MNTQNQINGKAVRKPSIKRKVQYINYNGQKLKIKCHGGDYRIDYPVPPTEGHLFTSVRLEWYRGYVRAVYMHMEKPTQYCIIREEKGDTFIAHGGVAWVFGADHDRAFRAQVIKHGYVWGLLDDFLHRHAEMMGWTERKPKGRGYHYGRLFQATPAKKGAGK